MLLKRILCALLLLVFNIVFVNNSIAQLPERDGNQLTFRGNKFTMGPKSIKDTFYVVDPITGKETMSGSSHDLAVELNGKKICELNEVSVVPESNIPNGPLDEYLLRKIISGIHLDSLSGGSVRIYLNEVVIDKTGNLVFYNLDGIKVVLKDNVERKLAVDYDKLGPLLADTPPLKPARLNGVNVNVRLDISLSDFDIKIKNHKATYVKRPPELRNAPLKYAEN